MRFLFAMDGKTRVSDQRPDEFETLWADLEAKDQDQLETILAHLYPAHPAAVARVLNTQGRRPNLLVQQDAVIFDVVDYPDDAKDTKINHIGIFFGQRFLVTTHWQGCPSSLQKAWEYMAQNKLMHQGVDFALYQYLSRHVNDHATVVSHIDRQNEEIHRQLLEHPYRNLAPSILDLRREIAQIHRYFEPEVEIFNLLGSSDFAYVDKNSRPYFQDLSAQMGQVNQDVETSQEGLSGTVQAYTSMQSNEISKIMWFLTIISVIALPATTVASIYGMNFNIPEIHWPFGYWYALTLMAAITMALMIYMRRRRWLM